VIELVTSKYEALSSNPSAVKVNKYSGKSGNHIREKIIHHLLIQKSKKTHAAQQSL
jgi:hypothetical protein